MPFVEGIHGPIYLTYLECSLRCHPRTWLRTKWLLKAWWHNEISLLRAWRIALWRH